MTTHEDGPHVPGPGGETDPPASRASPANFDAIARVGRALVGTTSLADLVLRGLVEVREVLGLEIAALYLPDVTGRPRLVLQAHAGADQPTVEAGPEVAFDAEAWGLAISTGAPLVFHDEGGWLVDNPFRPPAKSWMVLPLVSDARLLGVVLAASPLPLVLDRSTQTTLTLICDLLAAGIATAELRQSLERAELERERLRLAALVHDSLAQDLALAVRELALLDTSPDPATAAASMARLREAVASAHGTVRARLKELLPPVPLGGVHETVGEVCAQFEDRGMDLRLEREGTDLSVPPAASVVVVRVLTEALANAEKHASGCAVLVRVDTTGALVRLAIADAGPGFDVEQAPGREQGHFGLVLMRDRAREGGGELSVTSTAAGGTHVLLEVPV